MTVTEIGCTPISVCDRPGCASMKPLKLNIPGEVDATAPSHRCGVDSQAITERICLDKAMYATLSHKYVLTCLHTVTW